MDVGLLLQLLLVGLVTGAIYALIALGYTMVYGVLELINFAHGDIFMIGTLVSIVVVSAFGITDSSKISLLPLTGILIISCLTSIVVCALVGVLIERIAYRPLRNAPRLAPLISAIGVSLILQDIGKFWKGYRPVLFPTVFPRIIYHIGPITISNIDFIVLIVAVVLMVALQTFVTQTRTGRAIRAVAQDREAAALMGVNVDRTIAITFLIGAGLAGAAGFIYELYFGNTIFSIGFQIGLIAFTAAVLGGIGNIIGAMLGGLLIGLVQALTTYIPDSNRGGFGLPNGGTAWAPAVVFGILILILVFRPTGLLGQQTPDKV